MHVEESSWISPGTLACPDTVLREDPCPEVGRIWVEGDDGNKSNTELGPHE